jgi:hypothetical protein
MHPNCLLNIEGPSSGQVQRREHDGDNVSTSEDTGCSQGSEEDSSEDCSNLSDHRMKRQVKMTEKAR